MGFIPHCQNKSRHDADPERGTIKHRWRRVRRSKWLATWPPSAQPSCAHEGTLYYLKSKEIATVCPSHKIPTLIQSWQAAPHITDLKLSCHCQMTHHHLICGWTKGASVSHSRCCSVSDSLLIVKIPGLVQVLSLDCFFAVNGAQQELEYVVQQLLTDKYMLF